MKRPITTLGFLLLAQVLIAQAQQVKLSSAGDMRGAYTMLKQVADTGTGEFAMNTQQLKIFTGKYVMYAHRRSATDSSAEFGIGTYKVENGKVIEHMFYTASGPTDNTYELAINRDKDGYTQVINFPGNNQGGKFILTEGYANASRAMTSPLDGAWRMKSLTVVDKNGKSTTYRSDENAKQFKVYQSGNFMWANYIKNKENGRVENSYGYGTFEANKRGEITETNTSSTYATDLVGKPLTFKIKLTGSDMYEQSNVWIDGSKRIEVYERLK